MFKKLKFIFNCRERGSAAQKLKQLENYRCLICEAIGEQSVGFSKEDGVPYVEVHHVIPVSTLEKGTLGFSNMITVCANHHRQLHYGIVELQENNKDEFIYLIDGDKIRIQKLAY